MKNLFWNKNMENMCHSSTTFIGHPCELHVSLFNDLHTAWWWIKTRTGITNRTKRQFFLQNSGIELSSLANCNTALGILWCIDGANVACIARATGQDVSFFLQNSGIELVGKLQYSLGHSVMHSLMVPTWPHRKSNWRRRQWHWALNSLANCNTALGILRCIDGANVVCIARAAICSRALGILWCIHWWCQRSLHRKSNKTTAPLAWIGSPNMFRSGDERTNTWRWYKRATHNVKKQTTTNNVHHL